MSQHEGIFRSAYESIVFALNYCDQQSALSPMAKLLQGPGLGSGRGLVGLDGAGQAGMVLAELEKIGATNYYGAVALVAHCLPQRVECHCQRVCCRGWNAHPLWSGACEQLDRYVLQQLSGQLTHRALRQAVIAKHFGRKVSIQQIADECGVHRNTAGQQAGIIRKALKGIEGKAWEQYTTALEEVGMLIRELEMQGS